MKLRALFSACLAGASMLCLAQTHVEGIEYYSADQLGNARELLTRNMNNPGTDKAAANYYLGLISLRQGDEAQAKKYFDAGIAANPDYAFNYVGQGELILKQDAKAAQKLFKQAESLDKKNAALQVDIARALYNADPVAYAKDITKHIEKAQKFDSAEPAIYIFMGDQAVDQKDWGTASGMYEMATNYDPQATGAYVKYANMYKNVNPAYSIQKLKALLSSNPNSALGQRQLANTYYDLEKYDEAAKAYGEYVKNPNHFVEDEGRYALLLFANGDYQQGYDYASALLNANPSNFTAKRFQFMNAAQIEALQSQLLPLADALFNEHKADPKKNSFAAIDYTLIADEFARAKRFDDAIAVLNEGISEIPEQKSFLKNLALVYSDQGDSAKALSQFQTYLAALSKPGYADNMLMANLAYVASFDASGDEKAADLKLAADYAAKAAALNPNTYRPLKRQGDVAALLDPSNALKAKGEYYVKAIEVLEANGEKPSDSDMRDLYKTAGEYSALTNNNEAARRYLTRYLEVNPADAQAKKLLGTL